jgi:hypothetical protein
MAVEGRTPAQVVLLRHESTSAYPCALHLLQAIEEAAAPAQVDCPRCRAAGSRAWWPLLQSARTEAPLLLVTDGTEPPSVA